MISRIIDATIAAVNPLRGIERARARKLLRGYAGAESNRITQSKRPQNRSANSESAAPYGADALRAWSRMLVRDNAYAWGVVDTITSSVIGGGIQTQSNTGSEPLDLQRDSVWHQWQESVDVNESLDWHSFQSLAMREIVEAGEVLVHFVTSADTKKRVPLSLELIEADRIASDADTVRVGADGTRIVRGIELDGLGKAVAYHVYTHHPDDVIGRQVPLRLPASECLHLFRRDRIGQTRGVSWFAPVVSWLRDLGVYLENEMVASAVSSCFTAAIKTKSPVSLLNPGSEESSSDANANVYDSIQPGAIMHLAPDEDITFGSPGRPNSAAEPWISLILRGIAVGTGLSYETVARDYSRTNYSSNRASQLEDRRRFRQWQKYMTHQLCQPVWHRFVEAASLADINGFPSVSELLLDANNSAPVEHLATGWEWVDPTKEQAASEAAIASNQSTLRDELAKKGKDYRRVLLQRAKEKQMLDELGLPDVFPKHGHEEPDTDAETVVAQVSNGEV